MANNTILIKNAIILDPEKDINAKKDLLIKDGNITGNLQRFLQ